MSAIKYLTNGLLKENPTLVLDLGTRPTLAVTTSANNAIGMGIATTFVLLCSNILIAAFKNYIPNKVRIPSFIVIIATFVTIVNLVMQAYTPDLHKSLGVFIPLIVVNCIILGRAEAFAQKNSVFHSILDAIGMGLGFTIALLAMGSIRELLGNGSIFNYKFVSNDAKTILLFIMPPGAFITYGFLIALTNNIKKKFNI